MRKNRSMLFFSTQSILCLAFSCLIIYALKDYAFNHEYSKNNYALSQALYVEVAETNELPFMLKLKSDSELERLAHLYYLPRKLRNGDKLILSHDGTARLSRISGRKSLTLRIPIGINSASVDDLVELPGIGPKLAERIIKHRNLKSSFNSIEDLDKVEGIGQQKLEAIRSHISLD